MRQIFLILLIFGFFSCNQQTDQTKVLQKRIDSLEVKLANTYKPGFGDFMGSIQAHHSKLWFAGQNENWELADFEIHELMETIEDIMEYQAGRKETDMLKMIISPLDSVDEAIDQKNLTMFNRGYALLTNTCNSCHQAAGVGFNVVKIPESSPYSNQEFKVVK